MYCIVGDKGKLYTMILASILYHDIRDVIRGWEGKASVRVYTGVGGESWCLPSPQVTSVMSHTYFHSRQY